MDAEELNTIDKLTYRYNKLIEPNQLVKWGNDLGNFIPKEVKHFIGGIGQNISEQELYLKVLELLGQGFHEVEKQAAKYSISKKDILKKYHSIDRYEEIPLLRSYQISTAVNEYKQLDLVAAALQGAATGALGFAGIPFNLVLSTFLYFRAVQSIALYYGYDVTQDSDELVIASKVYTEAMSPSVKGGTDELSTVIAKVMVMSKATIIQQTAKKSWADMAARGGVPLLLTQMRALAHKSAQKALEKAGQKGLENTLFRETFELLGKKLTQKAIQRSIPFISAGIGALIDTAQMNNVLEYADVFYQKRFLAEKEYRISLLKEQKEHQIIDAEFTDSTTKGHFMSKELSPKYNPAEVEAGRYQKWLDEDVFKPSGDKKAKPYSIVIPPPNVTGKLHLGHAWDTTLQDIIIRQKRMQGFDTLWLPGMDHAGIATQAKVEERLREQGITRYDLGREKFLDKVWEWKDEYAATIKDQWGKMGISVDYSRERFTLDEGLSKAVRKVFVDLYKKGWIYRGEFIINWDPAARTALSDIEVIHKDVEGAFYHMNYMLEDGSRALQVATTRPETMFGDVAVAVNPEDDRYKDLIGQNVILPIVNKAIPIVADEHADPEFGTGVVKITPAHDPNDFLVGGRHDLPQVNVMNDDGTMNDLAGEFVGMDRFEAREAVVAKLEEIGALVEIEKRVHSVGHSERSGAVVEPRLSTQWFVKMDQLAKNAIANQDTDDKVEFYPPRFNDTFMSWMENVHDWVISRQLWWGHQIPAWYNENGDMYVGEEAPEGDGWVQDEDVLDTWFSSALWPFSTMGWPDADSADFKRYFPTSTLVTGYDIIFFWVSRMIFQSLEFTGRKPFSNVLIHGLIRDEEGRKMSKSLGNGIDPMDVIEKYGADALRWFLSNGSAPGQDVRFSYEKMDASWNFINKIWNISRYILMNNEGLDLNTATDKVAQVVGGQAGNVTDRWILHNLNETIAKVTENFDKFEFGVAGHILYNFIWEEFANWYVELTKEVLYSDNEEEKVMTRAVLLYTLDKILRLLHPIMPFVTEEIFAQYAEGSIVTADYPVVNEAFENADAHKGVESLKDLIRAVRNARAEVNVAPSKPITILVKTSDADLEDFFKSTINYIRRFTNPETLEISADLTAPELAMSSVITGAEIFLPLADLLNVEEELARLDKELAKWQKELDMVGKKLGNERFVANAKPEVVQKERDKQADYQAKYDATQERITEMKKLIK